jgi:hypothetical protein
MCHSVDLSTSYSRLPICYGVDDLDRDTVCSIVGAAMLAALPMTVWSKLMRKGFVIREATKPVLLLWVLFRLLHSWMQVALPESTPLDIFQSV